ncbi:hypothetical protein JTE90_015951 [Oedothorax gibbosus]|uniref:EGF-like domain-containing protein n=1 Tax=Oedothorax gibbosus TaxID=931172 RepID=A0AAV6TZL9_9ARAC|nr:hypothetical protein JTE90_015951 [Oedothorax gibbosus]
MPFYQMEVHSEQETASEDITSAPDIADAEKVERDKELELYKLASRIDPKALKMAMGEGMTEGPYVPQTPSPYCCYNGGTCHGSTHSSDDRWCTCFSNFTGRFCEMDVDECKFPNVCEEHQLCENTYGSYKCICEDGFVEDGHQCLRKTSCLDEPCLHFADCIDKEDGRVLCVCRLGYSGVRCEKRIPECDDSSCSDGEVCVATVEGFQCVKAW